MSIECRFCGNKVHDNDCPKYVEYVGGDKTHADADKVVELLDLVQEAFHSYQMYLQISGVIDTPGAKLALLKWPDIAQTAISCINDPTEDKLAVLRQDLCIAIIAPMENMYDSMVERLEQLTSKKPAGVEDFGKLIVNKAFKDPCGLKKEMISELNKMFVALQIITGIVYPEFKGRI